MLSYCIVMDVHEIPCSRIAHSSHVHHYRSMYRDHGVHWRSLFPKNGHPRERVDFSGQNSWSTTIDSGKDDYATAIIETSDGGYAICRMRLLRNTGTEQSKGYPAGLDRQDRVGPSPGCI